MEERMRKWKRHLALFLFPVLALGASLTEASARDQQLPEPNPGAATLRAQAARKGLYMGVMAETPNVTTDAGFKAVAGREFNLIEPGNQMKVRDIHPRYSGIPSSLADYNFGPADQIMDYAKASNMKVRGHTIAWDTSNPGWLCHGCFNATQLRQILEDHIDKVLGHFERKYPGMTHSWDVVNEPLANGVTGSDLNTVREFVRRRGTVWLAMSSDPLEYMRVAFRRARQVAPNVKLCLNDYGNSGGSLSYGDTRSYAILTLITQLKREGVPVDCVGFQGHLGRFPTYGYTELPQYAGVVDLMRQYAAIGVEVHWTEFDFADKDPNAMDFAAGYYGSMLKACLDVPNCTVFQVWGLAPKNSSIPTWWPANGYLAYLPFNDDYRPNTLYNRMMSTLQAAPDLSPARSPLAPIGLRVF
jgi:endo-1,4-beta-xylanase